MIGSHSNPTTQHKGRLPRPGKGKTMKKLINGKRYDTDTADIIGWVAKGSADDFTRTVETLFRKRSGEYFLNGFGGNESKYAVRLKGSNIWTSGDHIIPLTTDAAAEWAKENLSADEYEKAFGTSAEEKRTVTFSLPESVIEMIKQGASKKGIPMSEYVAQCIKKGL